MAQSMCVVGIDVSKSKLDAYVNASGEARQVTNDPAGHRDVAAWAARSGASIVVMEASGGYEKSVARALRRSRFTVHVVDPKRVRLYARAMGQLAKTDRIDARVIAEFGAAVIAVGRLPLPAPDDPERDRLGALLGARLDLVEHRDALRQQIDATEPGPAGSALRRVNQRMKVEIAQLERRMAAAIARHEPFARLARRLETVPGLGPVAIAALLAWLPELGYARSQRIAALVGVAPFAEDSGQHEAPRHIRGGRKKLRNVLYMATVCARTWNPVMKRHYERLEARGKPGKLAIVACMRKLLGIITAMVMRQEDWMPRPAAPTSV